jgi:hypothetical protein
MAGMPKNRESNFVMSDSRALRGGMPLNLRFNVAPKAPNDRRCLGAIAYPNG